MISTMMDEPLGTRLIVERGERLFKDSLVFTFDGQAAEARSYAQVALRARKLASGLQTLGVRSGDRVATLAWNRQEHLEAYLAVPAMGAVLHTLNLRLFPEQIGWIIDHAEDKVLLIDCELLPALAPMLGQRRSLRSLVVIGDQQVDPPPGFDGDILAYTEVIAGEPMAELPVIDERSAAAMCYTSGTTGNPKGVVYSHRSIFLHSLASLASDAFAIRNSDRLLMLPAMFHASAWGMPYAGWLAGSDMVMPGPHLQAEKIASLVTGTRPTLTAAVPTILNDLLALNRKRPVDLSSFRSIVAGGSAVSRQLIEQVKEQFGVDVVQGWGMTETSPMCVLSHPPRGVAPGEEPAWRAKSGRPVAGMQVRIVDDDGNRLAEDGTARGQLQLRGPWVSAGYYRQGEGESPLSADGWLNTGDVGTIDPLGYVQLLDRTKDLIKSGGEWISSIDLEAEIARYPGVREVAVIAVDDPRWEERPLAIVAASDDNRLDFAAMRGFLAAKVARFMIPEYWTQVSDLPKTSVGKIDKQHLRSDVREGLLGYERELGFGTADRK